MNIYRVMVHLPQGPYFGVQIEAKDRAAAEVKAAILFPESCEVHATELIKGVESINAAYYLRALRSVIQQPGAPT